MRRIYFIKLLVFILFGTIGQQAFATCGFAALATGTIATTNITVQRDIPVGTTLATVSATANSGSKILENCNSGGYVYHNLSYYGGQPSSVSGYYKTNIPGVGVQITGVSGTPYTNPSTRVTMAAVTVNVPYNITIKFIKTGDMTSGDFQTGLMANVYGQDNRDFIEFNFNGGRVTVVSCSIITPNINIPLDPALASSFTGVNSTKGDKAFTIGLQCDATARINATMSFGQDTDTTNKSVIAVAGKGSAGVASGVGIQLLYGSTPLQNNTNVVLKTSSGGQEFPVGAFTARYFQTKSTVTTGDANATATLNLTYQ